nr:hypothetical protein [Tanacetum cinerariifolium]
MEKVPMPRRQRTAHNVFNIISAHNVCDDRSSLTIEYEIMVDDKKNDGASDSAASNSALDSHGGSQGGYRNVNNDRVERWDYFYCCKSRSVEKVKDVNRAAKFKNNLTASVTICFYTANKNGGDYLAFQPDVTKTMVPALYYVNDTLKRSFTKDEIEDKDKFTKITESTNYQKRPKLIYSLKIERVDIRREKKGEWDLCYTYFQGKAFENAKTVDGAGQGAIFSGYLRYGPYYFRVSAISMFKHFAFWEDKRYLEFMQRFSDVLDVDQQLWDLVRPSQHDIIGIGWDHAFNSIWLGKIGQFGRQGTSSGLKCAYDYGRIDSRVKLVRNVSHHFEYPDTKALWNTPTEFEKHILTKFPGTSRFPSLSNSLLGNGNLVAVRAEGNAAGHNGNQIRCYNCRGLGHFARDCIVRPRRRDAAYLQTQLLIAQKEEAGIQ